MESSLGEDWEVLEKNDGNGKNDYTNNGWTMGSCLGDNARYLKRMMEMARRETWTMDGQRGQQRSQLKQHG